MSFSGSVCQPSILRMVICPEASSPSGGPSTEPSARWNLWTTSAQNNIAAVSAEGSTVCVLVRRLNSSWSCSTASVVRADFHWLSGKRVNVNRRSPASSRLSATARHFSRHLRMNDLRRVSISFAVLA